MKDKIIGGIVVVVLGGTTFAVSQSDITKNFAQETGMSQEQAQKYVEDAQNDLASFKDIGKDAVKDGNSLVSEAAQIDCVNYTYEWESSALTCYSGKSQLQTIGNNEIQLGTCFEALDTDLNSGAKTKINECITDIDALNTSYDLPIALKILETSYITEAKNTNAYNKSVLKTALDSN